MLQSLKKNVVKYYAPVTTDVHLTSKVRKIRLRKYICVCVYNNFIFLVIISCLYYMHSKTRKKIHCLMVISGYNCIVEWFLLCLLYNSLFSNYTHPSHLQFKKIYCTHLCNIFIACLSGAIWGIGLQNWLANNAPAVWDSTLFLRELGGGGRSRKTNTQNKYIVKWKDLFNLKRNQTIKNTYIIPMWW